MHHLIRKLLSVGAVAIAVAGLSPAFATTPPDPYGPYPEGEPHYFEPPPELSEPPRYFEPPPTGGELPPPAYTGWSHDPAKQGMIDLRAAMPIEGCNAPGGLVRITDSDEPGSAQFWCGTPPECLAVGTAYNESCKFVPYCRRDPRGNPAGAPGANGCRDPEDLICVSTGLHPVGGKCPPPVVPPPPPPPCVLNPSAPGCTPPPPPATCPDGSPAPGGNVALCPTDPCAVAPWTKPECIVTPPGPCEIDPASCQPPPPIDPCVLDPASCAGGGGTGGGGTTPPPPPPPQYCPDGSVMGPGGCPEKPIPSTCGYSCWGFLISCTGACDCPLTDGAPDNTRSCDGTGDGGGF